jgi:hypothetical protein
MNFEFDSLFDFSYVRNMQTSLDYLENLIIPERWNYTTAHDRQNQKNPILENYINHTFKRLAHEYRICESDGESNKIIYIDEENACFNTGLYTVNYEPVFAFFNKSKFIDDKKPWFFYGFVAESASVLAKLPLLPGRANYLKNVEDLIYNADYSLRRNAKHILEENLDRFPEELREQPFLLNAFEGAIVIAQKRVRANYRIAIPTFFNGQMCMLLPIDVTGSGTADFALAVQRLDASKAYLAKTCLTLDMAYNDARLIAKPDDEWLRP